MTDVRPEDIHAVVLARAVAPIHGHGGLERHVHDLVTHLLRCGLRVTLITQPAKSERPLPPTLDHPRLTVHTIPYRTFPFAGRRGTTVVDRSTAYPVFGWRAGRLAARLVKAGGIQIVHGLGASAWGYAHARRRNWFETVPFVFNPQGLEEFGATDPSRSPLKLLGYRPLQAVVRSCARAADRVLATDQVLLPTVLRHLQVEENRVSVIPNAVDLDEVDRVTNGHASSALLERLGLTREDVLLVGVSRLEENKGFQNLIAALARLNGDRPRGHSVLGDKWRCVIVGEGPYRQVLERQIRAAGLGGHVLLPGRIDDVELHAWYEAATLFVHPTLYEGSSLVTLEAMAHRRAVVATSAGGVPDKVVPGLNGWLVEPGNPEVFSGALADALTDRARLVRMGHAGRAIVEREFAWSVVVDRLVTLYRDVLSGR